MEDYNKLKNTKKLNQSCHNEWQNIINISRILTNEILQPNWYQIILDYLDDFEDENMLCEIIWWYSIVLKSENSLLQSIKNHLWEQNRLDDEQIISIIKYILKLDTKEWQFDALSAYVVKYLDVITIDYDIEKIIKAIASDLHIDIFLGYYTELSHAKKRDLIMLFIKENFDEFDSYSRKFFKKDLLSRMSSFKSHTLNLSYFWYSWSNTFISMLDEVRECLTDNTSGYSSESGVIELFYVSYETAQNTLREILRLGTESWQRSIFRKAIRASTLVNNNVYEYIDTHIDTSCFFTFYDQMSHEEKKRFIQESLIPIP